jgi:hypothetical protein
MEGKEGARLPSKSFISEPTDAAGIIVLPVEHDHPVPVITMSWAPQRKDAGLGHRRPSSDPDPAIAAFNSLPCQRQANFLGSSLSIMPDQLDRLRQAAADEHGDAGLPAKSGISGLFY